MKVVNLIIFSGQIFPLILKTLIICIEISPEQILTAAWVFHELSCTTSQALSPSLSPCKHRPSSLSGTSQDLTLLSLRPRGALTSPSAWLILFSLSHPSDLSLSPLPGDGALDPSLLWSNLLRPPLLFLYSAHTVPWCGPLWLYHFLGNQTMSFRTEWWGGPSPLCLQHWNSFCC